MEDFEVSREYLIPGNNTDLSQRTTAEYMSKRGRTRDLHTNSKLSGKW